MLGPIDACRQVLRLGGDQAQSRLQLQQAVVLLSSQKTLPVAVTLLGRLAPAVGEAAVGLASMAAVMAHLAQIMVGSMLVAWWVDTHRKTTVPLAC